MKKILLEEFKKILKEKYFFHFHTTYTDGLSNVREYFDFAFRHNIYTIIFTEHVRKKMSYNFNEFLEEIKKSKISYPGIKIIIGAEAKIMPGGELDISEEVLDKIQLICFACHSFPDNADLYFESFKKLFFNKRWEDYIRIWVHPGRFLKKNNLFKEYEKNFVDLLQIAKKRDIFIENNLREQLPPFNIISFFDNQNTIIGFDIHSVEEIKKYEGNIIINPN